MPFIRMLRPIQWSKNVFVFAPLVFSRHLFAVVYLERTVAAFAVFSLVSGVVYIVNDIAERSSDRLHPLKRMRPIASGEVSVGQAIAVAVLLLAFAVVIVGGMGNLRGTFISAFSLGMVMAITARYWSQGAETMVFIVIAIVLFFRPIDI